MLLPSVVAAAQSGNLSVGGIVPQVIAGGAGGAILTAIIGAIKNKVAARVAKADARPGGYVATGGYGGIVGNISHTGRIALTYLPVFKNTYRSELKITTLPSAVKAAKKGPRGIEMVDVAVKDDNGKLLPGAIPVVTISADGGYTGWTTDTTPRLKSTLWPRSSTSSVSACLPASLFRGWYRTVVRPRTRVTS